MKKFLKLFVFILALSITPQAFASSSFTGDYEKIFMTAGKNDYTPKNIYEWNEKPWLYIKLSDSLLSRVGQSKSGVFWTWNNPDPSQNSPDYLKSYISTRNDLWLSFSDSYWNSIKKQGDWSVRASTIFEPKNTNDELLLGGSANFHINPEPVSSLLFISGGAALAAFGKKRKKNSATI